MVKGHLTGCGIDGYSLVTVLSIKYSCSFLTKNIFVHVSSCCCYFLSAKLPSGTPALLL